MSELIKVCQSSNGETKRHAIFFHGLGGDAHKTWGTLDNENEFWPQWLVNDIDSLSIWTVAYEASATKWKGTAMHLTDRAKNLLALLLAEPELQSGELILVGHSLGGLVIKQILRIAEGEQYADARAKSFIGRVHRVSFLATPHNGATLANILDFLRILFFPSHATACLVRRDPNLRELNQWYRKWVNKNKINHLILSETQPIKGMILIVEPDSSDPGLLSDPILIDADHISICKPNSSSSAIYSLIKDFIGRKVDLQQQEAGSEASLSVLVNFPKELIDREIEKQLSVIVRSRFYPGYSTMETSFEFAEKIINDSYANGTNSIKSKALAWCARLVSSSGNKLKIDEYLTQAKRHGDGHEIIIAEAFRISANGEYKDALQKLTKLKSHTAYSAALFIVGNNSDAVATLEWSSKSGLAFSDFDGDGKFKFMSLLLELSNWNLLFECANQLKDEDYLQTPALLRIAAMANLLQTIPDEFKLIILQQLPLNAREFPLASDEKSISYRSIARELFERSSVIANELECKGVANCDSEYALWLEIRDPLTKAVGLKKLEDNLRDQSKAFRWLFLGFQFGIKLDIAAVEREIDRDTALSGGKSYDAALARLALMFNQENPKKILEYISQHREQFEEHFSKVEIAKIEIEMLAKSGFGTNASEKLEELILNGLTYLEAGTLRKIIEESNNFDVDIVEAKKVLFESSDKLQDLEELVLQLEQKQDWVQLSHYGNILFSRTISLQDAERLSYALHMTKNYAKLSELLRDYPEFLGQSEKLKMFWSWILFRDGSLNECEQVLSELRDKQDNLTNRALFVNLSICSGNWEALVRYIENEWDCREQRSAVELLQACKLAIQIGSSRAIEFAQAAVNKNTDDPNILIEAFFLSATLGIEDDTTVQWLHNAVQLSGVDGPIKPATVKDIIEQVPEWNRRVADVWQKIYEGQLPVFMAANFMNKALADFFLLPTFTNPIEQDVRKRIVVPAYSGARKSLLLDCRVICFDVTALLTFGSLGLLEKLNEAFDVIVIPHSTLWWLFEEKHKVAFHQPKRIEDAFKIRQMIADGFIKEFHGTSIVNSDLASNVGEELAALLTEAKEVVGGSRQKIVVKSSPVYRVGSLMDEEVNLSLYSDYLCSCMAVVDKLQEKGQLTASEEQFARSYLKLQEKQWANEPSIVDNAVLYLDDLAVTYLQHTRLLEKLYAAGLEVYISRQKIDEINALLRYSQLGKKVNDAIEYIRKYLLTNIKSGKVMLGEQPNINKTIETNLEYNPTFSLFFLAKKVDAFVIDDRSLNRHNNIDIGKQFIPAICTLDVLDYLYSHEHITFTEFLEYRTNLRKFGYIFISVRQDELEYHLSNAQVINSQLRETAELRAIRENILKIRMSDFLQLPMEVAWLINITTVFRRVLFAQWSASIDEDISIAKSNWLIEFLDFRGWAHCRNDKHGFEMAEYGFSTQLMTLLICPAGMDNTAKTKYFNWIEKSILKRIKEEEPGIYLQLIKRTKEIIGEQMNSDLSMKEG